MWIATGNGRRSVLRRVGTVVCANGIVDEEAVLGSLEYRNLSADDAAVCSNCYDDRERELCADLLLVC